MVRTLLSALTAVAEAVAARTVRLFQRLALCRESPAVTAAPAGMDHPGHSLAVAVEAALVGMGP
ncbi:MAG: hypothetical protein WBA37_03630 [Xanthobacteraceae bacterium]